MPTELDGRYVRRARLLLPPVLCVVNQLIPILGFRSGAAVPSSRRSPQDILPHSKGRPVPRRVAPTLRRFLSSLAVRWRSAAGPLNGSR